ncbi:MAG: YqgE/AlgH family protein [Bacteroidota bacterium]
MNDNTATEEVKVGDVLLAEPFMWDENFRRAVVVLCEHTKEGSLGFIMNRPMSMRVDELIADFPDFDSEVYFGGPVQTDTIHYIHTAGDLLEDSVKIVSGVYWGGSFEKLKFLVDTQLITPNDIRFFVGYSGWSKGQLKGEMHIGSWVTAPMFANYMFKSQAAKLWRQVMHNKGDTYTVIAQIPESIDWN